jgi:hypothetical protein
MSQFMNSAKRIKGWMEVEAKLDGWIKEFKKSKRTAHIRFLDKLYEAKPGKPDRPMVENIYRKAKSSPSCGLADPDYEMTAFIEACVTSDKLERSCLLKNLEEDNENDSSISQSSKEIEQTVLDSSLPIELEVDQWLSFEIGKVFDM